MEEKIVKTQVKLKKRHQEWLNKTNKLKPEQKKTHDIKMQILYDNMM